VHAQVGRLAEDQATRRARVPGVQAQPGEPGQQGFDGDLRLQPSQVRAEAEMRAVREGQMPSGVRTADIKNVGLAEDGRVPVRSGDGHRDLVTGPDAGAAEPDLPGRVPVDDRRGRRGHLDAR
jgi:hypothetical protein